MEYTVKQFRDNLRKALNELDSGGRVTIRRYEKVYRVLPTDLKTVKQSGIEVITLESPKIIKSPAQAIKAVKELPKPSDSGNCKVHGIQLDKRGKCLQKGCKYA